MYPEERMSSKKASSPSRWYPRQEEHAWSLHDFQVRALGEEPSTLGSFPNCSHQMRFCRLVRQALGGPQHVANRGWRKRRLEAGNKPITINRNLQRLQSVLSKAVLWKVVERHPFAGMKPLKSDRSGRYAILLSTRKLASVRQWWCWRPSAVKLAIDQRLEESAWTRNAPATSGRICQPRTAYGFDRDEHRSSAGRIV